MASTIEKKYLKVTTTKTTCNYILVRKSDGFWHVYSRRTNEYLGSASKLAHAQELCRDWASAYGRVTGMRMSDGGGGGCYVTTACVEILGLADDGPELTALRKFREESLRPTAEGRAQLALYEEAGPLLAAALRASASPHSEARRFYDLAVAPAVAAITKGDNATALRCYLAGMRDGLARHGIANARWNGALAPEPFNG